MLLWTVVFVVREVATCTNVIRHDDAYSYERRKPEKSLLCQVAAKNLMPFLKQCEVRGIPLLQMISNMRE